MAAANDHPLALDAGLVLYCSISAGLATRSEISITNPIVLDKMALLMLSAWCKFYVSYFLVNLAVDSIFHAYKIFFINKYKNPLLCILYCTTNQWRVSSNPVVQWLHHEAMVQTHSVIFQGHLCVLLKAYLAYGLIER